MFFGPAKTRGFEGIRSKRKTGDFWALTKIVTPRDLKKIMFVPAQAVILKHFSFFPGWRLIGVLFFSFQWSS